MRRESYRVSILNTWKTTPLWLALSVFFSFARAATSQAQTAPDGLLLTNAAQIRALSHEEAGKKLPVKLRATVTTVDPVHSIFIEDETGGTFLNIHPAEKSVASGDILEIEGTTYFGFFVPGINPSNIVKVGHGELPKAKKVSLDDLLSGRWHYQRVEASGIVRSVTAAASHDRFILKIAMGPRKLDVQIITPGLTNLPPLVNARVRVAGLAAGYLNLKHQLITPQIIVSRAEDIHIESAPPNDPFDIPLTSVNGLLNFNPAGLSNHRVRIRGVVTHQQHGEAIFLRDEQQGLMVQTLQNGNVRPGDIIEAVGFPAMGPFSAYLEDAEFRTISHGPAPEPVPTTVQEALLGSVDANLVKLTAKLIDVIESPPATTLVLQSGDTVFRARLPGTGLSLRNGSQLGLTGVCLAEKSSFANPVFVVSPLAVELLLRSAADIDVHSMPSWWTTQRLAVAASLLLGLAGVGLIWILMLRRRVTEQAAIIREKVQREATLEERHRMAREMHDTLAQTFSGLGFQLDAIHVGLPTEDEVARQRLDTARSIVRHGQEDFRRSLMNLRAQELDRGDITQALPEFARHITDGTGVALQFEMSTWQRGLPESVENNLLRIGQECLTNAVNHGHPKKITLTLSRENGTVRLIVRDDGVGFDPKEAPPQTGGHFGWRGIQERTEQIRGHVERESHPGKGTTVTVTIPVEP